MCVSKRVSYNAKHCCGVILIPQWREKDLSQVGVITLFTPE